MQSNIARLCKMTGIFLLVTLYLCFSKYMPVTCIFRKITNIPCVGCGSTRALICLSKGEITDALYYNPVTVILALAFLVLVFIVVKDIFCKTNTADKILHKRLSKLEYATIIIVFIANWVFNIIKFK
ncbi:MAG: DUF2752 domain-containing protein [Bacteroidales bacterium]|nr:DUF2752 domain-containing protein [Bacteroidales bacterium]